MSDAEKPEEQEAGTLEPQAPESAHPAAEDVSADEAEDLAMHEPRDEEPHRDTDEAFGEADDADATDEPVWAAASRAEDTPGDGGGANEFIEIVKTIVYALGIALVLRILLFQPFTIPSASMEPNLYEGDYIVVSKWSYGYSRHSIPFSPPIFDGRLFGSAPERGDIAVFKWPRDNRTDYIKRVIGLPGDRIQMVQGVLHINGEAARDVVVERGEIEGMFGAQAVTRVSETLPGGETFMIQDFGHNASDLDNTAVYEVPAGHYFMMGDNRDNSIDSRVPSETIGVGLVPEENLVGKAQIILFSWEPGAALHKPWTWFANVRPSRFFTVLE